MNKSFSILLFSTLLSSVTGQTLTSNIESQEVTDVINLNKESESSLIGSITKVMNLNKEELENDFSFTSPNIIKFKIDENINVIDDLDNNYGDLSTFYNKYLKNKYLPCIELTSEDIALNYLDYVNNTFYIRDLAIYSDDIKVFKEYSKDNKLKKNYFIYDISKYDLSKLSNIRNIINVSNIYGINTFSINGNINNLEEIINEFSKFNKTTWSYGSNDYFTYNALLSGASAIIYDKDNNINEKLSKFKEKGRIRPQFVAAHRGLVDETVNENSLEAIKKASEANATYVEVDLQISKDKEIFLCHNDLLSVTSDCKDNSTFQKLNSDEIKTYHLIDNNVDKGVTFPTLKEAFLENKDNDLIFILEFKFDQGFQTMSWDVAQYVDKIVKECHYEDRVIGITFFKSYFETMKTHMPYMPSLYLGLGKLDTEYRDLTDLNGTLKYLKKYNVGIDYGYNSNFEDLYFNYLARGYYLNSYTFKDLSNLKSVINIATSDNVINQKNCVFDINLNDRFIQMDDLNNLKSTLPCDFKLYDGSIKNDEAKLIILDGNKESSDSLICTLYKYDEVNDYGLYSNIFEISKNTKSSFTYLEGIEEFKYNLNNLDEINELTRSNIKNNNYLYLIIGLSALFLIIIATITFIFLKKKIGKN